MHRYFGWLSESITAFIPLRLNSLRLGFLGYIVLITNHWYFYGLSNMNLPCGNCIRNALRGQLRISWRKCEEIYILWFIVWRNCCFVTGRACVWAGLGHEGGWALLAWRQFERVLANFAILNQIIFFLYTSIWLKFESTRCLPELTLSC